MKRIIAILVTIVTLFITYSCYYSDEKIILRKSETLLQCFDGKAGVNGLGSSNFRALLYNKVAISLPDDEDNLSGDLLRDRATLTAVFSSVLRNSTELSIEKKSIALESINDDLAIVSIHFHAKVVFSRYTKDEDLVAKITFIQSDESGNTGWKIKVIAITE